MLAFSFTVVFVYSIVYVCRLPVMNVDGFSCFWNSCFYLGVDQSAHKCFDAPCFFVFVGILVALVLIVALPLLFFCVCCADGAMVVLSMLLLLLLMTR